METKPVPAYQPKKTKQAKRVSLANVATLLLVMQMVGQFLGFLRVKLINGNFPAVGPNSSDAYFAAFKIPDFFFFTIAAGALGVAFMPVLSDRLHRGDRSGVNEITSSLLNLLALVTFVVGILIFIFARPLITHIVAPGMVKSPDTLNHTVMIIRLLAFNPFLFTISGILSSLQQTLGRFFFYAAGPLLYNFSIIASIYVFKDSFGIVGLGVGALLGALLQLAIIASGLYNMKYKWSPKIAFKSSDFRQVLRNLPARSLDQGADQINSIVETNFARRLGPGFISYYNNAFVLSTAPELLIGTAISTAAFPRLNARLSQNRPDLFRKDFLKILRVMFWITTPVAVVAFFCRGYLARIIFTQNSPEIATILGFLVGAIFFRTLYTLISRWFYSQKDTKTPMLISLFTISLNILLAYFLAQPGNYGIAGLAIAQSIVAFVEVLILFTVMVWRDHKLLDSEFLSGVSKIISVTGFTLVAGYTMLQFYPLGALDKGVAVLGGKLFLITSVVFAVHLGVSALFGLEEVKPVFYKFRKVVLKPLKVG